MNSSECEVCYASTANCKLVCGHRFCRGCVKTWYEKSHEPTCPFCRRRLYFKGLYKMREEWEEESYELKVGEVLSRAIDESITEEIEMDREYKNVFGGNGEEDLSEMILDELKSMEKTCRFLKSENVHEDDIDYVLRETDDYYSDKCLNSKNEFREKPRDRPPPRKDSRAPRHRNIRGRSRFNL